MTQLLTVCIPTYNRNEILAKNLRLLLPQLAPECRLLILDNCSDVPVEATLAPIAAEYPNVITFVRNRANIGAGANVLRCVEAAADTSYLWILGDDDAVRPDAVELILSYISQYPDCVFFNFSSQLHFRKSTDVCMGLGGLLQTSENFSNLVFVSSSVFRTEPILKNVRMGYLFLYSQVPHLVVLLTSLTETSRCCFSADRLVDWDPPAQGHGWSFVTLALGLPVLMELPIPFRHRRSLLRTVAGTLFPPMWFMRRLVSSAVAGTDWAEARHLFGQLYVRVFRFHPSVRQQATASALRLVFRIPIRMIRVAFWLARRVRGTHVPTGGVQEHRFHRY